MGFWSNEEVCVKFILNEEFKSVQPRLTADENFLRLVSSIGILRNKDPAPPLQGWRDYPIWWIPIQS